MRSRIDEKGHLLFRANEDKSGGIELDEFPPSVT
jgi:hypothetical protein